VRKISESLSRRRAAFITGDPVRLIITSGGEQVWRTHSPCHAWWKQAYYRVWVYATHTCCIIKFYSRHREEHALITTRPSPGHVNTSSVFSHRDFSLSPRAEFAFACAPIIMFALTTALSRSASRVCVYFYPRE
jgi:hypothetical protein